MRNDAVTTERDNLLEMNKKLTDDIKLLNADSLMRAEKFADITAQYARILERLS